MLGKFGARLTFTLIPIISGLLSFYIIGRYSLDTNVQNQLALVTLLIIQVFAGIYSLLYGFITSNSRYQKCRGKTTDWAVLVIGAISLIINIPYASELILSTTITSITLFFAFRASPYKSLGTSYGPNIIIMLILILYPGQNIEVYYAAILIIVSALFLYFSPQYQITGSYHKHLFVIIPKYIYTILAFGLTNAYAYIILPEDMIWFLTIDRLFIFAINFALLKYMLRDYVYGAPRLERFILKNRLVLVIMAWICAFILSLINSLWHDYQSIFVTGFFLLFYCFQVIGSIFIRKRQNDELITKNVSLRWNKMKISSVTLPLLVLFMTPLEYAVLSILFIWSVAFMELTNAKC